MFNLESTLKSAIGYTELGMFLDATNEIESIPPEQKKFLSGSMCPFGNLSCSQAVEVVRSCGKGTLEKTFRRSHPLELSGVGCSSFRIDRERKLDPFRCREKVS